MKHQSMAAAKEKRADAMILRHVAGCLSSGDGRTGFSRNPIRSSRWSFSATAKPSGTQGTEDGGLQGQHEGQHPGREGKEHCGGMEGLVQPGPTTLADVCLICFLKLPTSCGFTGWAAKGGRGFGLTTLTTRRRSQNINLNLLCRQSPLLAILQTTKTKQQLFCPLKPACDQFPC